MPQEVTKDLPWVQVSQPITAMLKCFLSLLLAAVGTGWSLGLRDCCLSPEQPIRPSLTLLILNELHAQESPSKHLSAEALVSQLPELLSRGMFCVTREKEGLLERQ